MKHLLSGAAMGLFLFASMMLSIWISGGTLGQRCVAKGYNPPTGAYDMCVRDLSNGKVVYSAGEIK